MCYNFFCTPLLHRSKPGPISAKIKAVTEGISEGKYPHYESPISALAVCTFVVFISLKDKDNTLCIMILNKSK